MPWLGACHDMGHGQGMPRAWGQICLEANHNFLRFGRWKSQEARAKLGSFLPFRGGKQVIYLEPNQKSVGFDP